jgi:hypothetical protein
MSKLGSHHPFGHLKHKLWPKERPGVKLAIWLPTTESQESTRFPCVQVACDTSLESSRRGLQLWFRPRLDRSYALEVPQSCETPILGDFGTPTWESRDKNTFRCHSRGVYYMGEGGGFPRVRVVVSLVSPRLPVACHSTKGAPKSEQIDSLVGLMQVRVSNQSLSLFLVLSRSLNTPLYPF